MSSEHLWFTGKFKRRWWHTVFPSLLKLEELSSWFRSSRLSTLLWLTQWELIHTLNDSFVLRQISGYNILPLYTESPWNHDSQNILTRSFLSIWLRNLRKNMSKLCSMALEHKRASGRQNILRNWTWCWRFVYCILKMKWPQRKKK